MNKKIIGISPRFATNENSTTSYLKINSDYIKQIIDRNGFPLIIIDENNIDEVLNICDGFLIIGGDDINPVYYGENNNLNQSKNIDSFTDRIDEKIINFAINHQVPTLGICRGIQAMAAFLGGSLHQDINDANLSHPNKDNKHFVSRVNETKLSKLLPDSFLVNTFHHQAVNKVPNDFIVTYKNEDVIESIEHRYLPIIGIQWHPERYYTKESEIIFDYFFEQVNNYGKKHF